MKATATNTIPYHTIPYYRIVTMYCIYITNLQYADYALLIVCVEHNQHIMLTYIFFKFYNQNTHSRDC